MEILSQYATFRNGKKRPQAKGSIPVYGGNGIIDYTNEANLQQGVIIGRVGAYCGSVFLEKNKCWVSDNAIAVEAKGDTDLVFLYYLLKCLRLNERKIGTSQPLLTQEILNNISVSIPPSIVQKRIASILGALDDKIELNERINKNLEEQAQAVFNKFYDIAEKQKMFTSIIHVLGGGTPKTGNAYFWNGSIPFFTPKDIGTPYTFQTEKYVSEEGLANCNSHLYPTNTTFVTARGTVGKVGIAGRPMAMNQSCYALMSDSIDPVLVYFYALKAVDSLKHKASGAVFDAIVTRDFETEVIKVLNSDDADAVLEIVAPMMSLIHKNTAEIIKLSSLRDTLLPRLLRDDLFGM